jgi:hypothetical protein
MLWQRTKNNKEHVDPIIGELRNRKEKTVSNTEGLVEVTELVRR